MNTWMTSKKLRTVLLSFMLIMAMLVTACGSNQAANNHEQQADQSPQASETGNDTDQNQPAELKPVTVAIAVNNIATAAFFIAEKLDFFADEGIDYKPILVEGSGPAVQALVGGSAQFAYTGASTVIQGSEEGVDLLAVASTLNRLTMDLVVRNEVLEQKKITPESPIEERLKALQGLKLGVTGAGSPTDTYMRYYLSIAGLQPETNAQIIGIGGGPALAAALKQGQIDAFHITPPVPQQIEAEGAGKIIISPASGEVPGIEDIVYAALVTRKSYADANPEITRAMARAVARGNNYILDHPEEALAILQQDQFKTTPPDILKSSLESIAKAVAVDGKMTETGWSNALKIDKLSGALENDLDPSEGVMWTNEYVKDVNGQSE